MIISKNSMIIFKKKVDYSRFVKCNILSYFVFKHFPIILFRDNRKVHLKETLFHFKRDALQISELICK